MSDIPTDLAALTVPLLRELCERLRLDKQGNRDALVARIEKRRSELLAWETEKANPPKCPEGYRFVFDNGAVMDLALAPHPIDDSRLMFIQGFYAVPMPYSHYGFEVKEHSSGANVDSVVDNVRRNVGANYPVREFLRPGERSRTELEAENAALRAELVKLRGPRPTGPMKVAVRVIDGPDWTVTAWPVRDGWHACPPCSDSSPVYATPEDAALAHASKTLNLACLDAKRLPPGETP